MALTPKQAEFCRVYMETGNASEAYRQAYDASNMSYEAIKVEASRLLKNPTIALTIQECNDETLMKGMLTREDLIAELEEARIAALTAETPQASAATQATMGKAKLLGMDKVIIDHRSSDGSMSPQGSDVTEALRRKYGSRD